jgi:hypothetical protein
MRQNESAKKQLNAALNDLGINIPDLIQSLKFSQGIITDNFTEFSKDPIAQIDFATWNREQTILLSTLLLTNNN